jgi:Multicopper oxidase
MAVRDIYLKIERISDYSPVEPDDHVSPPIQYRRDCLRTMGHEDATIPDDEVAARRLTALIYREYLDPQYLFPKPDKLVAADINEPAFPRRVPGTVIYALPGDWLRIHVKNGDGTPHSFHLHGLRYGIDSDGSWPFGTQSDDGRRSDEICPGQTWTYTYHATSHTVGAWPFHDHWRDVGLYVNRGLFGAVIVLPDHEYDHLPRFPYPPDFEQHVHDILRRLQGKKRPSHHPHHESGTTLDSARARPAMGPVGLVMRGGTPMRGGPRMSGGMPMGGHGPSGHGGGERIETPPELLPYLVSLDELAHAPQPLPPRDHLLHVPRCRRPRRRMEPSPPLDGICCSSSTRTGRPAWAGGFGSARKPAERGIPSGPCPRAWKRGPPALAGERASDVDRGAH